MDHPQKPGFIPTPSLSVQGSFVLWLHAIKHCLSNIFHWPFTKCWLLNEAQDFAVNHLCLCGEFPGVQPLPKTLMIHFFCRAREW